ncbi:MAG TPA: hypothetical protein VNI77_12585, partial [Nitrososphaera sp.]|nr:hypothetical protein [Nitrososphaera sp.]
MSREVLNLTGGYDSPLAGRSPFPKLLTQPTNPVVKLTDRKIRWIIIMEKEKGVLGTSDVARLQNV